MLANKLYTYLTVALFYAGGLSVLAADVDKLGIPKGCQSVSKQQVGDGKEITAEKFECAKSPLDESKFAVQKPLNVCGETYDIQCYDKQPSPYYQWEDCQDLFNNLEHGLTFTVKPADWFIFNYKSCIAYFVNKGTQTLEFCNDNMGDIIKGVVVDKNCQVGGAAVYKDGWGDVSWYVPVIGPGAVPN
ncbi:immunomodulatory protein [Moniliophthora roreri MCA 2997]|uniref:Immunomodulatory protein n=1 Tax=Moniliophthora roreri (strain MCA 2997) TaxID=1381753 RepID=V2W7N3_MONRO|nr:immunomodulatory protein [Moniliophthora roreri MCA 2997]